MNKFLFLILFFTLHLNAQKVYKTPSGSKYHLASCRMVKNVSSEITLESAAKQGLSPCKICNPSSISVYFFSSGTKKANGVNAKNRCKGITKAGTRCKHYTSIGNDYCYQHQP